MSKDIRQVIDKVKSFNQFVNENIKTDLSVDDYLTQVNNNQYHKFISKLFDIISEEGWLESLEDFYNKEFNKEDFSYTTLNLSDRDKNGLIKFDDNVVEKFNDFDIKLKGTYKYPFKKLDFIDYDKGIVYIVHLISV